jgi:hypothetical protein
MKFSPWITREYVLPSSFRHQRLSEGPLPNARHALEHSGRIHIPTRTTVDNDNLLHIAFVFGLSDKVTIYLNKHTNSTAYYQTRRPRFYSDRWYVFRSGFSSMKSRKKSIIKRVFWLGMALLGFILYCNIRIDWYSKDRLYDTVSAVPHYHTALVLGTPPISKSGGPNLFFPFPDRCRGQTL